MKRLVNLSLIGALFVTMTACSNPVDKIGPETETEATNVNGAEASTSPEAAEASDGARDFEPLEDLADAGAEDPMMEEEPTADEEPMAEAPDPMPETPTPAPKKEAKKSSSSNSTEKALLIGGGVLAAGVAAALIAKHHKNKKAEEATDVEEGGEAADESVDALDDPAAVEIEEAADAEALEGEETAAGDEKPEEIIADAESATTALEVNNENLNQVGAEQPESLTFTNQTSEVQAPRTSDSGEVTDLRAAE